MCSNFFKKKKNIFVVCCEISTEQYVWKHTFQMPCSRNKWLKIKSKNLIQRYRNDQIAYCILSCQAYLSEGHMARKM